MTSDSDGEAFGTCAYVKWSMDISYAGVAMAAWDQEKEQLSNWPVDGSFILDVHGTQMPGRRVRIVRQIRVKTERY